MATLEDELDAMRIRIVRIAELAGRAAMTDRGLRADRAMRGFQVSFVEFMEERLSREEGEALYRARRRIRFGEGAT